MDRYPGDEEILESDHFRYCNLDHNSQALHESFQLRFQVYCLEKSFLPAERYPDQAEQDQYDVNSAHFGAYNAEDVMVASARLVMDPGRRYPLLEHCQFTPGGIPEDISGSNTVEVSRLVMSKKYRRRPKDGLYGTSPLEVQTRPEGEERRRQPEIVLGLYQAMYRFSRRRQIRYCLAAMERPLARLLTKHCFNWVQIGPEVNYYGPVSPYLLDLKEYSRSLEQHRPDMYNVFSHGIPTPSNWEN